MSSSSQNAIGFVGWVDETSINVKKEWVYYTEAEIRL